MMPGLRESIEHITRPQPSTHIGLWLSRFYKNPGLNGENAAGAKQEHLKKALAIQLPPGYREYFALRKDALMSMPNALVLKATVTGRLAIGLGASSVWENNVELHHTWGLPVIPGSALKGLAASFAHKFLEDPAWRRRLASQEEGGGDSHNLLFGNTDEQGLVTFHDALWEPGAKDDVNGLVLDTITVHHQQYYQDGETTAPPADWDSPVPIPFLSVTGSFVFALTGPSQWVKAAQEILEAALTRVGIGAKTSGGYGRMTLAVERSKEGERLEEIQRSIERFQFPIEKQKMNQIERQIEILCEKSTSPDEKRSFLRLFLQRVDQEKNRNTRKTVRQHIKKLTEEWADENKRQLLKEVWEDVFGEGRNKQDEKDTEVPEQDWPQVASSLFEKIRSNPDGVEVKQLLADWLPDVFPTKPTNRQLDPLLHELEKLASEQVEAKEVMSMRNTVKKGIKSYFK